MERRLAAILSADVVGYTRLMGVDETGTLQRLTELREEILEPLIAQHHGRIVKLMGDGLLVEFASVVESVACARDWQQEVAKHEANSDENSRLEFRIGINLGDIIIKGDDIHGDGVNIAARMEQIADANGICISGPAFDQVKNKLELEFEHLGVKEIKNIADPVRVYRVVLNAAPGVPGKREARSRKPSKPAIVALLAVVGVVFGVLIWTQLWTSEAPDPKFTAAPQAAPETPAHGEGPSIAVLPFANKSEFKDQAFFADGITDDIIIELTKVSGLLVISRDSTINYRGKMPNLQELAKALNVAYVLQGSVRRAEDSVRINATLVDASTGRKLWGDRYDGKLANVFTLQDKITEQIVAALSLKLSAEDRENLLRRETTDLQAYEKFLRGRDLFLRFSKTNTFEARKLFEETVSRDGKFARAYALLAWTHVFEYTNGWAVAPETALKKSLEIADKALALNDKLAVARFVKGVVFRERREYVEALAEAQKAINADPNYANAYVLLATILYYAGRPEEGLAMIEKAEKVNPLHPSNYPFHKGQALFILKRYDEAIDAFSAGLNQNPTSQRLRVWLAASFAQAGNMDDAQWEAEQVLINDPGFKLSRLTHIFPFKNPQDLEHFNDALSKVGFENRW